MLNENQWNSIRLQVLACSDISDWVSVVCSRPFSEVSQRFEVTLVKRTIDQSYLGFLREQIELGARGDGWTAILKRRLDAIKPWLGKELSMLSIAFDANVLWIRFEPEDLHVVLFESHCANGCDA